VQMPVISIKK